MRKLIAAINMTIDGYCDHISGIPDDELHDHYTRLLSQSGMLLYGRITYQLMEYWRTVVKQPTGNKSFDDFAHVIDQTPKLVFSHTLKSLDWESAKLAKRSLQEEVMELKQQEGKDILVGSPSLILELTRLHLIDEYQLCVHPIIAGGGLSLFKNIDEKIRLHLTGTKTFGCGVILLYYKTAEGNS